MKNSNTAGTIIETPSLKCELNTLSRADGSSILSQDKTVTAVAVYGPVEVKQHKMQIDKANIEVLFRPKSGLSQLSDRLRESIVSKICETAIITTSYPRAAIFVVIQEMQTCGNDLACSVNGTCLALIHAGISMNFLFAAVTFPIIDSEKTSMHSQENEQSSLTFVFENTSDRILTVESEGTFTEMQYKEALDKCRSSSKVIFQFYKDMIEKYATKF